MKVTQVGVHPFRNSDRRVKAAAWVVLDGELRLNGLKLVEGRNGLFVSYPSEQRRGTDQWFSLVNPTKPALQDEIKHAVITAYRVVTGTGESGTVMFVGAGS